METKTSCHNYREPLQATNKSAVAPVPVLYECGDCHDDAVERACVRHAVARPAKLALVQTRSWCEGCELEQGLPALRGNLSD
jgi:hypothetical protein